MGEETRSPQAERSIVAGAADGAPTAPHATMRRHPHRHSKKRTGPEKFWDRRGIRNAFAVAFVASIALHYALGPWSLLPEQKLDFVDTEGELSIPIDLIEDQPPEPPAPEPPPPPEETPGGGVTAKPTSATSKEDAGARDAGADAAEDAGTDAGTDAETPEDGGKEDAGAVAAADAGALADAAVADRGDAGGENKSRDPSSLVAAASDVQAGPPLVRLFVNMEEIRKNPVGVQMGPLLSAIPQWDDFMSGTQVDPVRDTDWVYITGPSLMRTERDVILVHYSASDKLVDRAIDVVSKKYASGGVYDAGVPGVKAALGHADRAQRVFLRPQSRVLAVVPPDYANTAAKTLVKAKVSTHARPGEAMRLTLQTPHRPMPFIPQSISEMRLWVVPRADGGAEVYGEGDTPDPASASAAADALRKVVRSQNSIAVRLITQNLLGTVDIIDQGSMVRLHGPVTREQLDALLGLVAGQLGVTLPSDPARPPPTSPPRTQSKH
ncbi:hypothetical protein LVJ94_18495 [Pendulispora rubella]|uniref:Uncharacterized protein n=1 Tax=Pendulispora rubella TaxID=2741070 RepID=A0ABZ2LEM3_9BACT